MEIVPPFGMNQVIMMKRWRAQKVYYDIERLLGMGLTSEVYKAFRQDSQGWTKHKVALKIIRSKNDVQVLKREFENLSQVRSKYCVRVLAWENLPKGPALVLEYIDGVTLDQVLKTYKLSKDLAEEIFSQICLGLKALHRSQVIHGDLNLKNIMINKEGVIKIIDFGVAPAHEKQLVTLPFASENRLKGGRLCPEDDFISLNKIIRHICEKQGLENRFQTHQMVTRMSRRRELSQLIKGIKKGETQLLPPRKSPHKGFYSPWLRGMVVCIITLFGLVTPLFFQTLPRFYELDLRSTYWFSYAINGLPHRYGPAQKKLRKGHYEIEVKKGGNLKKINLSLSESRTILLQPDLKLL